MLSVANGFLPLSTSTTTLITVLTDRDIQTLGTKLDSFSEPYHYLITTSWYLWITNILKRNSFFANCHKQTASGKYRDSKKTRRSFDLKDKIHTADSSVLTYECTPGFGRFFHVTGKAFQDTIGQDSAKAFYIGGAQESKMGHNVFIKGILGIFFL